jgi:membrane protein required for colicin V production
MTVFDYVVLGIVALSLVLGLWRGVVGEMIALAAWVSGIHGRAWSSGSRAGQLAFSGLADPAVREPGRLCTGFCGVLVAMSVVRHGRTQHGQGAWAEPVGSLLGMIFGLARAVCWSWSWSQWVA